MPVLCSRCPNCGASATPLLDGEASFLGGYAETSGDVRPKIRPVPASATVQNAWRLGTLDLPGAEGPSGARDVRWEIGPGEILQIVQFVFHSPHVQGNLQYRARASATTLIHIPDVDLVNAFAADHEVPGIDASPPLITVFGGLVRAMRLAALGMGMDRVNKSAEARKGLVALMRSIGGSVAESGEFTRSASEDMVSGLGMELQSEDNRLARLAHSFAAAMLMTVISHELGHIALGHTLGQPSNLDVSRNQEREADSFSSSVVGSSPFSDYLVAGAIFFWVIMTWADAFAGAASGDATHPHARERLFDLIRANREQASDLGIDHDSVRVFIPE